MNVLGLKITSHDTGAALISGEKIVALAEERLCRIKHSPEIFPKLSIEYCLKELHLSPLDIDLVVIDQVDLPDAVPMKKIFEKNTNGAFKKAAVHVINHHDAHAATAFFASPFNESAVLVCDGAGEKFRNHLGVVAAETESLYRGVNNSLHLIHKTTHIRQGKKFLYTFGIGKLYTHISQYYLGMGRYNEGKMMGLAPYGAPTLLEKHPRAEWATEENGEVICNARIFFPEKTVVKKLNRQLRRTVRALLEKTKEVIFGSSFASPKLFPEIMLEKPSRKSTDPLPDDYYTNVAATVQKVLEWATVTWAKKLKNITQSENLCVAGGVGLNIDANKKYVDEARFKNLFVQPAASDTGIPLGCALWGYHMILNKPRFWEMKQASLGRTYSAEETAQAIEKYKDKIIATDLGEAAPKKVASLIAEGNIIGWVSGGAEYGPRALGHRSIICDARIKDMKDILNNRVKHRESWRPFAASVLKEYMTDYFELEIDSPFMLLAAQVKKEKQKEIPSVVHVDGTCRVQSVTPLSNKPYYELIKAFYELTGTPLVLNTSFNLGGEPIVETPEDAIDSFLRTNIDYLVIGQHLIKKRVTDTEKLTHVLPEEQILLA